MVSLRAVGTMALALPEATEKDHHGIPSFRVGDKVFATVPDGSHVRIMLDEVGIRAAVAASPEICQELYWGARLACVVVDLGVATPGLIKELLVEAWARKAPRTLVRDFDDR